MRIGYCVPAQDWGPGEPRHTPLVHIQSHHQRLSFSGSRTSAWWWSFPSPETWLSQHAPLNKSLQWTQVFLLRKKRQREEDMEENKQKMAVSSHLSIIRCETCRSRLSTGWTFWQRDTCIHRSLLIILLSWLDLHFSLISACANFALLLIPWGARDPWYLFVRWRALGWWRFVFTNGNNTPVKISINNLRVYYG